MPDARSGKAVDYFHAEFLRGPGRVFQFLGGPGVDTRRIAVAPHVIGQNGLVPGVDVVEHGLTGQMGANGKDLHIVLFQKLPFFAAIAVVFQGLSHLEVIAPAGQFQAVVTKPLALAGQIG